MHAYSTRRFARPTVMGLALAFTLGGLPPSEAKLPTPVLSEEQKAKAAEAKAQADAAAQAEAQALGRAQDRVASRYFQEAKAAGKAVAAPTWTPPPAVTEPVQPSSGESFGQKQAAAPKVQNTAAPTPKVVPGKPTPVK